MICETVDCGYPAKTRGLCGACYQRRVKDGSLLTKKYGKRGGFCSVEQCGRRIKAKGFCKSHYETYFRCRRKPVELRKIAPPGQARYQTSKGYVVVSVPGCGKNRPFEHRVVMERYLGRKLHPDETVHHKNGDRADNNIENLELWSKWQPHGQRVEDKIAYARSLLLRYGDLVERSAIQPAKPKLRVVK